MNLAKTQSDHLRLLDKPHPLRELRGIQTKPTSRAARSREQPFTLVVPQGVDGHADACR